MYGKAYVSVQGMVYNNVCEGEYVCYNVGKGNILLVSNQALPSHEAFVW